MDKTNNRKLRIAPGKTGGENGAMNEDTRAELLNEAFALAYEAFEAPTDEHIEWVFERLLFNWRVGAGGTGAITLH